MKPSPIKSFCIDFNWDAHGAARPGLYAHADPAEHVRWYRELGANTIQTFCVSYNGYAWYHSGVAPVIPGLEHNFLADIAKLGHAEGMAVLGYFCLGSNPFWGRQHPHLAHDIGLNGHWENAFIPEYLDYFCRCIVDALQKTEIDGFMIDWFRPLEFWSATGKTNRKTWLDCEKQMFRELMGESFPREGEPDASVWTEFERRVLELAWTRIKDAVDSTRPAIIWPNAPFQQVHDPIWNGHKLLREADWILNESPDVNLLSWLHDQIGPNTTIVQNLCGWKEHDASAWRTIDTAKYGLYGFAQADPETTLPSPGYTPACVANQKNIAILREAYHAI